MSLSEPVEYERKVLVTLVAKLLSFNWLRSAVDRVNVTLLAPLAVVVLPPVNV